MSFVRCSSRVTRSAGFRTRRARRAASLVLGLAAAPLRRADVAVFHEFARGPGGGGNQFLRGLIRELGDEGLRVEENRLSRATPACLYNSFNFDFGRLRAFARRANARMVHRVDGPVTVYRGVDDGSDRRIWEINRELADATVFQSQYSLERHRELGLEFADPVVIRNAPDPAIFHPRGRVAFSRDRRLRVISTSWSSNPLKGADVIAALEELLDWNRIDYTFVGRSPIAFRRVRTLQPLPPRELAAALRTHDVFLTASRHEACSNALLEALACGLPVLWIDSGSNSEVAGEAGFAFRSAEEVPALLDRLAGEYEERQARIEVPSLDDVARRYLEVLGVG